MIRFLFRVYIGKYIKIIEKVQTSDLIIIKAKNVLNKRCFIIIEHYLTMKLNEEKFYQALENIFTGAEI